jgi:hypothetical protein
MPAAVWPGGGGGVVEPLRVAVEPPAAVGPGGDGGVVRPLMAAVEPPVVVGPSGSGAAVGPPPLWRNENPGGRGPVVVRAWELHSKSYPAERCLNH